MGMSMQTPIFSSQSWKVGLLGWLLMSAATAAEPDPRAWLLEQIRLGESMHREDLVSDSLYRLEKIAPQDPRLLVSRIRQALRQARQAEAKQWLAQLQKNAPGSVYYQNAQTLIAITDPEKRQWLQSARLQAAGGHVAEAFVTYQKLWGDAPPAADYAVEYWKLVARLPGQQARACAALGQWVDQEPENSLLIQAWVELLFATDQAPKAYQQLERMAQAPLQHALAAELWWERLATQPATEQHQGALADFIRRFADRPEAEQARRLKSAHQAQLNDPVYQARLRGLALVEKNQGRDAIAYLERAWRMTPHDSDLLGALGQAYAQKGDRARADQYFSQALSADQNGLAKSKWQILKTTNQYWWRLDEGDQALKRQDLSSAEQAYRAARQLNNQDPYALIGLADVASARHDWAQAEGDYRQALRLDSQNASAVRGLFALYRQTSPTQAQAYLASLPKAQQRQYQNEWRQLQVDQLKADADRWHQAGRPDAEQHALERALLLAPDDIWLTYHLAGLLADQGRAIQGDQLFSRLLGSHGGDPECHYAYALYLANTDRDEAALVQLHLIPAHQRTTGMRDMAQRLTLDRRLREAEAIRAGGELAAARAYLQPFGAELRVQRRLAEWDLAEGLADKAGERYQAILMQQPTDSEALLGLADSEILQGHPEAAKRWLTQLDALPLTSNINWDQQRQIGHDWQLLGETNRAGQHFARLRSLALKQPASPSLAWFWRDAGRQAAQQDQPELALADGAQAMQAAGLSHTVPQSSAELTSLTRVQPADDWLTRSIRSDVADQYRHQEVTVTLAQDLGRSSGHAGYSNLTSHTTMLQLDAPLSDGKAFLRMDQVFLDAGSFAADQLSNAVVGTCYQMVCSGAALHQSQSGLSIASGWQNDRWKWDLGTTPMGFTLVNVTGGLAYSSQWQQLGWTSYVSRRPMTNSLLSFAGTRDANYLSSSDELLGGTGKEWGGVVANNIGFSGSYDRGGAHGVWASLSAATLTGENVATNQRVQWMGGYYYKLINEDHRRVSIGLNHLLWHYQKYLADYALGQGGYFSPQHFQSVSIPLNYRQRSQDWSWELGTSVSHSWSKSDDHPRYPLQGLLGSWLQGYAGNSDLYNAALTEANQVDSGSSSQGWGFSLQALVEHRLTEHWFIGASVNIQHSQDYTPSQGMLYFRYSMPGWQGDLDLPLQPLTPYAEFR